MPNDGVVPTPAPNPAEGFQSLLAQHKQDGVAVASKLYDENYQLRQKNRELADKQPKDGTVILTSDEAKEWDVLKGLNMKASDVKKAIERASELEKQNKELASMESLREIADLGLEGSKLKLSVLKDQLSVKYPDAKITFQTVKDKDGKEAKVAFIQKTDKDAVTPFADFAKADLADYLPALKVTAEANQPAPLGNTQDPPAAGSSGTVFDRIRESVKEASKGNAPIDLNARFNRAAA